MSTQPTEYDLDVEVRPGYVYARLLAVCFNQELVQNALKQARAVVAEQRAGRLMLECEVAHAMTENDTVDLVSQLKERMPGMRIALVSRDTRHLHALVIGVNFAAMSGEDMAVFRETADAGEWLLAE